MVEFLELRSEEQLRAVFPLVKDLQPQIEEDQFVTQCLEDIPARNRVFALTESGQFVCMAAAWLLRKSSREGFIWVYFLNTHPEHRSRGYGKELMKHIETFGCDNGFTELRVHSSISRVDTHRFYEEKLGYSRTHYVFDKKLEKNGE